MKHKRNLESVYNFCQKAMHENTIHVHLLLQRYAITCRRSSRFIKAFVPLAFISLTTMACLSSPSKAQLANEDGPWVVTKVRETAGHEYLTKEEPHLIVWADVLRRSETEIRILYYSNMPQSTSVGALSRPKFAVGDELYVDGLIDKHFAPDFKGYWYDLLIVKKADD